MFNTNIQEVGCRQGVNIIVGRSPLGKFYFQEGRSYTGIDNSQGNAEQREFETKDECLKWLKGEMK